MNIKPLQGLLLSGSLICSGQVLAEFGQEDLAANGFLTQGYFYTDRNNLYGESSDGGSFDFRELGVNASYRLTPKLRVAGQLMSRKAGNLDDGEPKLDYALLDYQFSDDPMNQYGLRLGRLKIPFGFYNESRDIAFTRPGIMLPQSLYFHQARDLELSVDGAILYSYLEVPGGWLDIDLLYGKPQTDTNVEYAYLANDATGHFDDSIGYMARAIYNYDGGRIRVGGTLAEYKLSYQPGNGPGFPVDLSEFDEGDLLLDVAVLSAEYNAERWSLTGEYMIHDIDWRELGGVFSLRPQTTIQSYYLQLQYRLNQNWELMLRYDELLLDKDDPTGQANAAIFTTKAPHTFYSKDWIAGVGWSPTPNWLFRAEYHHVTGTGWVAEQDNPDPSQLRKNWNIFALQATYRF